MFIRSPDGLRRGLAEGGYIEGRNLTIEYRCADAHFDRLPALADELGSHHVALIATVTLPAAMAAKAASPRTPIVFVIFAVSAHQTASVLTSADSPLDVESFVAWKPAVRSRCCYLASCCWPEICFYSSFVTLGAVTRSGASRGGIIRCRLDSF